MKPAYGVTRLIRFCYGHRLLDYAGKCRHPHGHNGLLEVSIRSRRLDRLGMVMDFEQIKSKLQSWVDRKLDHKMILNRRDPLARVLKKMGDPVVLTAGNPTAENIAALVYAEAKKRRLPVFRVRLWETDNSFAECADF